MDRTIKIVAAIFAFVVIACLVVFFSGALAPSMTSPSNSPIYYFYGEGCPHCHNIEPFINDLTQKYPDAHIQVLEVWNNQTNQQIWKQVNAAVGCNQPRCSRGYLWEGSYLWERTRFPQRWKR